MQNKISIRPGTPYDENIEYLPQKIKESDIVVNENGNNSQPYPRALCEFHEDITGNGVVNEWYEYVPDSYDPKNKAPVVFSMHGGLMNGWGQAVYSSWTQVADREGFICVFPTASENNAWKVEMTDEGRRNIERLAEIHPEFNFGKPLPADRIIDDNPDVHFIMALLKRMQQKYNIDAERVYMQGMSMGNAMTGLIARNFGEVLAAAAGSGGPSDIEIIYDKTGKVKNRSGSLYVWQTRPELNGMPNDVGMNEFEYNRRNLEYWLTVNKCSSIPEIRIIGENNLSFYKGKEADVVYLDIKNRDHGQAFDEAELIWDYLFSGVRRNKSGDLVRIKSVESRSGDDFAIAFAEGCKYAWFHNKPAIMKAIPIYWKKHKYHGLYGDHILRGEYLCVPLSFLAEVFNANYISEEEGRLIKLTLTDGRELQFAEGCIGCIVNNKVESMLCEALYREGELLVPVIWFCRAIFQMHVSECNRVVYATDHYSILSSDTALTIKGILKSEENVDPFSFK